jgi:asparagine synthase (glutamine-hydrolysing)
MALVGVLSTGLLHEQMVRRVPERGAKLAFRTVIDRLPAGTGGEGPIVASR